MHEKLDNIEYEGNTLRFLYSYISTDVGIEAWSQSYNQRVPEDYRDCDNDSLTTFSFMCHFLLFRSISTFLVSKRQTCPWASWNSHSMIAPVLENASPQRGDQQASTIL